MASLGGINGDRGHLGHSGTLSFRIADFSTHHPLAIIANMDLSAPVDEGPSLLEICTMDSLLIIDELESFRSTWRQEIQKHRSHSPQRQRTRTIEAAAPEARSPPRETSPRQSFENSPPQSRIKSPLEMYESAIMKERHGNLSEAVIQYRKAFKVWSFLVRYGY